MSRIPLVEPEHASPEVRALYERFAGPNLPVLNVMKLFGNHADLLAGLTAPLLALRCIMTPTSRRATASSPTCALRSSIPVTIECRRM